MLLPTCAMPRLRGGGSGSSQDGHSAVIGRWHEDGSGSAHRSRIQLPVVFELAVLNVIPVKWRSVEDRREGFRNSVPTDCTFYAVGGRCGFEERWLSAVTRIEQQTHGHHAQASERASPDAANWSCRTHDRLVLRHR
jgi:hypothetical protein